MGKEDDEELTEDELEEMLASQFNKQLDKKHRGYGGYERQGVYRGAKAGKKED